MMHPITHVIFDFDGILVNSINVITDTLVEYAESQGRQVPPDLECTVSNMSDLSIFFNWFFDSIQVTDKSIDRVKLAQELVGDFWSRKFELIPGVDKFIKHLHKHNIPMAIATGNSNRHFNNISPKFGDYFKSENYFNHIICGWDDEEVVLKKPHPDVYIVCAKRFKTQPNHLQNILVIEDSLTGITGAVASGMKTLLINDRKYITFAEIADKITLIADTFNDFKPESLGLPAYEQ